MNLRRRFRILIVLTFCVSLVWNVAFISPSVSSEGLPPGAGIPAVETPELQTIWSSPLQLFERQSVYLDGRKIFLVGTADNVSANDRAQVISQRLHDIASRLNQASPQVSWRLDSESQLPVLDINGMDLMTITEADAQQMGMASPSRLADDLRETVQAALLTYQQERQPEYLWQQGKRAAIGFAGLLVVSAGLYWVQRSLRQKSARARQEQGADAHPMSSHRDVPPHIAAQEFKSWVALQRWVCRIGQGGIWGIGLFVLMGLFPYTRQWRPDLLKILSLPIKIGAIALTIYGLIRFGHVFIDRLFLLIQNGTQSQAGRSRRLALRFSTASRVTKNVVGSVLVAVGFLVSLSLLGLDLGPLLAGAGIIGLALSFASQNVLKDVINGFLILLEDQFGVGDVIVVGPVSGFVENMNLRITQLRNEEGRLITIPNSQIDIVQNLSKEWSRVDLMIPVALHADIDRAIELIHAVAEEMRHSQDWSPFILEPPMILGVDQLNHEGATVRLWIMTQPLKQWDVAREYRRRIKIAFDKAQIDIGLPQQRLHIHSADSATAESDPSNSELVHS